ncbi:hypothetical protein Vretimale_3559, partial [Volvox reticuliferus]
TTRFAMHAGGCLPASWGGGLVSLQDLDVSHNPQLCGGSLGVSSSSLPASWSRLGFLRSLALQNTGLVGTLPSEYASLPRLVQMDLSANNISGTLPKGWAPAGRGAGNGIGTGGNGLTQLRRLDLSQNSLRGTLPPSWSQLQSLQHMSLHSNSLSGTVPEAWGALHGLAGLNLTGNAPLCGPLPHVMFSGHIALLPVETGSGNDDGKNGSASKASPGRNGGDVTSEAAALAAAISGTALLQECPWAHTAGLLQGIRGLLTDPRGTLATWVAGTDPCGTAEPWNGVICDGATGGVVGLDLRDMGLQGSLPAQLALLESSLKQLRLDGNSLTGTLPESWALLGRLNVLSVSRNNIGGPLPGAWSALHDLSYLDVSHNALRGSLPGAWGNGMTNIRQIHVDGNSLNGSLPAAWAGDDSRTNSNGLVVLRCLTADGNSLSGSLPTQWDRLRELQELSLKDNLLEGSVPVSWVQGMTNLRYLGLSSNKAVCGYVPFRLEPGSDNVASNISSTTSVLSPSLSPPSASPPISGVLSDATSPAYATEVSGSVGLHLEADATQLGAPCLDNSNSQGPAAASVLLWAAAGASSVGTLVLVGLITAAAHAANRFRQKGTCAGGEGTSAEHSLPSIRLSMASGRLDNSVCSLPPSPRAPPGSPHMRATGGRTFHHGTSPGRSVHTPRSPALRQDASPSQTSAAAAFRTSPEGTNFGTGGTASMNCEASSPLPPANGTHRSHCNSALPSPRPTVEALQLTSSGRHEAAFGSAARSPSPRRGCDGSPSQSRFAIEHGTSRSVTYTARTPSASRMVSSFLGHRSSGGGGANGAGVTSASPQRHQELINESFAAAAEIYQALLLSGETGVSEQWAYESDSVMAAEELSVGARSPQVTVSSHNPRYNQRVPNDPRVSRPDAPSSPSGPPMHTSPGHPPPTASPPANCSTNRGPKLRTSPDLDAGELSRQLSSAGACSPCDFPSPVGPVACTACTPTVSLWKLPEQGKEAVPSEVPQTQPPQPWEEHPPLVAALTFMLREKGPGESSGAAQGGDEDAVTAGPSAAVRRVPELDAL